MSLLVGAASNGPSGYFLEDSLRFRASASAYLNTTFSTAGNLKTFTQSVWIKRGKLGVEQEIYNPYYGGDGANESQFNFTPSDQIQFYDGGGANGQYITNDVFRDTSAWYHIVLVVDTTDSTAADRVKIYVNNRRITSFATENTMTLNSNTGWNGTSTQYIGRYSRSSTKLLDAYMTEFHSIDGTALAPTDFGETDSNGTWIPKQYTGTYGTNGFYLPMKPTTQATGFNTVLYTGNGGTQSITGVGFTPDLVWVKNRDESDRFNLLTDTVRGATKSLASNLAATEADTTYSNGLTAFGTDGFSVGNLIDFNGSADKMVAWCWDAGGSTVTNTNGTIDSQVRANPSTGFSIVTYSGDSASSATIGHGLGIAPKMVIVKARNLAAGWPTQVDGTYGLRLNSTDANDSANGNVFFANTAPTTDVFTVGGSDEVNDGYNYVAYCFADVTGYQKLGSYTGNGSTTGPTVTTGFRPAFILIKSVDTAKSWGIWDGTRSVNNPLNKVLFPNASTAEDTSDTYYALDVTDTGFQLKNSDSSWNVNGNEFIYLAIAETRNEKFNFDASGNKNNWTPNNINSNASGETTYDIMSDVPTLTDEDTANFATFNPIAIGKATGGGSAYGAADGNLLGPNTGSGGWAMTSTTMSIPAGSGKFYFEVTVGSTGESMSAGVQVENTPFAGDYIVGRSDANGFSMANDGKKYNNNTGVAYGSATSAGGIIGVAVDASGATSTLTFYVNNVSQGIAYSSIAGNLVPSFSSTAGASQVAINFGQRPFAYTPPTGFKKLNTFNLPDSTIKDGSKYFDTALYTGSGAAQSITGTEFSPDFVWVKNRSHNGGDPYYGVHLLFDSIRGVGNRVMSSSTAAEAFSAQSLTSFTSDGFNVGTDNSISYSGDAFVGWQWRGSDSTAASIAAGSIDGTNPTIASTVSANTTAGFSVVTYTGNATAGATVGHGLGVAPAMVIVKSRSATESWEIAHQSLAATQTIRLNSTASALTSADFNNTRPSATVFTLGSFTGTNQNSGTYVAYCFAEVEGYSKISSYVGNGSADGPFIYTGFRPSFVLRKNVSTTNEWILIDSTRSPFNQTNETLVPNANDAEDGDFDIDILSNGFKVRTSESAHNGSGNTIIYMAFAENPFKNSIAR